MHSPVISFAGLVLLISLIGEISALSVKVIDVECIQEYAYEDGSPISGHFVVGGTYWHEGNPGMDFTITSPTGNVVYSLKGSFGEKFELKAPKDGMYKFCFKNLYKKPETVTFLIQVGYFRLTDEHNMTKNEHIGNVFGQLFDLKKSLDSLKEENKYLIDRESIYLWINEDIRDRIFVFTIMVYMLLAFLSGLQVIYIRHLFKNK